MLQKSAFPIHSSGPPSSWPTVLARSTFAVLSRAHGVAARKGEVHDMPLSSAYHSPPRHLPHRRRLGLDQATSVAAMAVLGHYTAAL